MDNVKFYGVPVVPSPRVKYLDRAEACRAKSKRYYERHKSEILKKAKDVRTRKAQQNRTLFINHFPPTPSTGIPPSPPDHPPLTNSSPASGHSEPEQDSTVRSSSEKLYIKHLCPSVDDIRHSTEGTLEHFLEGSLSALRESLPGLEASEMEGLRLVEGLKCDFRLALKEHGDDYTSLMDLEERIIHILYTICSIQLHHALVLSLIYRLEK